MLARLDVATGRLRWMTCGHPHPLIARRGSILTAAPATPGAAARDWARYGAVVGDIVEVDLEPGDGVLLYTDGIIEARTPSGDFFGEQRLRDLLAREHLAGDSPQEVVRRLVRTTIEHTADAGLRDDASMLYTHWAGAPSGATP